MVTGVLCAAQVMQIVMSELDIEVPAFEGSEAAAAEQERLEDMSQSRELLSGFGSANGVGALGASNAGQAARVGCAHRYFSVLCCVRVFRPERHRSPVLCSAGHRLRRGRR